MAITVVLAFSITRGVMPLWESGLHQTRHVIGISRKVHEIHSMVFT